MMNEQDTSPKKKSTIRSKTPALFWKLRRAIFRQRKSKRSVYVILNPAAGQEKPILKTLNRVFHNAGLEWELKITREMGDGQRLARKAVKDGADLVAVYGGDGSIMDVANGLIDTGVPLGILPGGTGNALSMELGIPRDLAAACDLIVNPHRKLRLIDTGFFNRQVFVLRVGVGLEEMIARTANRALKDRIGVFAYVLGTLHAINTLKPSRFNIQLDGVTHEENGLACMVANAGTLGMPGLNLSPKVSLSDGKLDVFLIRRTDLANVLSMAASMVSSGEIAGDLIHWQAEKVRITADPPQGIEADGEVEGVSPVDIEVHPASLNVIIPST